jgi:hypothetical protein
MTDAKARIDEAISTKATFSTEVSKGEAVGREEHSERDDGTGSG